MTADRSPDLLALLYEAAADGEETSLLVALGALGDAFACKVVHLVGSDAGTGMPLWDAMADRTGGALRDGARDYVAHHWRTDPPTACHAALAARRGLRLP